MANAVSSADVLSPGPILAGRRGVNYDSHVLGSFTDVQAWLVCGVCDLSREFAGFLTG